MSTPSPEPVADAPHGGERAGRRRASCAAGARARRRCGRRRIQSAPHTPSSSCWRDRARPWLRARWASRSNSRVASATGSPRWRTSRRADVDLEVVADRERRCRRARGVGLAAPQDGLHPGDDLARRERLGDVVVGAELEAEDAVDLAVARGEEQHRHRAAWRGSAGRPRSRRCRAGRCRAPPSPGWCCSISSSPRSPLAAWSTRKPASRRYRSSRSAMFGSSSTTTTVALVQATPPMRATLLRCPTGIADARRRRVARSSR